jgi:hypothetical protein
MTCLYCGKKLGFFSRYKDTPFCSEEHLRAHQDEMERALMERLGSKISAHAGKKDLEAPKAEPERAAVGLRREEPPRVEPPRQEVHREETRREEAPRQAPQSGSILGLSGGGHFDAPLAPAAPQRGTPRDFRVLEPPQELPLLPASERPIDKNRLLGKKETAAPPPEPTRAASPSRESAPGGDSPAPLCEDVFEQEIVGEAALDVSKPRIAPTTFAILIQADYCAPTMPDQTLNAVPQLSEHEFALEPASVGGETLQEELPPPTAAEASDFTPQAPELPRLPSIASLTNGPLVDIWEAVPPAEGLVELSYEAAGETGTDENAKRPIGERPSLPLRPRHRYPYAGSELQRQWRAADDIIPFTISDEWGGVEPGETGQPKLEAKLTVETPQQQAQISVPLSLVALAAQTVRTDEGAPFERDPAALAGRALDASAGLHAEARFSDWAPQAAKPVGATVWNPVFRYPRSAKSRPMPAVNFPSLFQLAPVLPPRPEAGGPHA